MQTLYMYQFYRSIFVTQCYCSEYINVYLHIILRSVFLQIENYCNNAIFPIEVGFLKKNINSTHINMVLFTTASITLVSLQLPSCSLWLFIYLHVYHIIPAMFQIQLQIDCSLLDLHTLNLIIYASILLTTIKSCLNLYQNCLNSFFKCKFLPHKFRCLAYFFRCIHKERIVM